MLVVELGGCLTRFQCLMKRMATPVGHANKTKLREDAVLANEGLLSFLTNTGLLCNAVRSEAYAPAALIKFYVQLSKGTNRPSHTCSGWQQLRVGRSTDKQHISGKQMQAMKVACGNR